jgi:hypothetical protein
MILNFEFYITALLGMIIFLWINVFQILLLPLRLVSIRLYRKLEGFNFHWGSCVALVFNKFATRGGFTFVFTGDGLKSKISNKSLVISNHLSSADWMLHLWFSVFFKNAQNIRFFLQHQHKCVPLIGWATYFHDMIFLHREYKKDANEIRNKLKSYKEHDTPVWLVIFPEGTFVTKDSTLRIRKNAEFAQQRNLKLYNNLLIPRVKGFEMCLSKEHKDAFEDVVDITFAISPYHVKIGGGYPLMFLQCFNKSAKGVKIHCNVEQFKVKDIPNNRSEWLFERFDEKEKLLEYYDNNGKFPGKQVEVDLCNTECYFWFTCIMSWIGLSSYFICKALPFVFWIGLAFILLTIVIIIYVDYKTQRPY